MGNRLVKTPNGETAYRCCGKTFMSHKALKIHKTVKHSDSINHIDKRLLGQEPLFTGDITVYPETQQVLKDAQFTAKEIIAASREADEIINVIDPNYMAYASPETYLKLFENECLEEIELTKRKNADYAGSIDAFKNFKMIEEMTDGRISVEDGIVVRLTDKLQRVTNLLSADNKVNDEKITDTLRDLSVYAKILKIYINIKRATV